MRVAVFYRRVKMYSEHRIHEGVLDRESIMGIFTMIPGRDWGR